MKNKVWFITGASKGFGFANAKSALAIYQATVGAVRANMDHFHGNQPGDPAKLAEVIVRLAASANPPLHLPIGRDAVKNFREKTAEMSKEVEEWEVVSMSTDHGR
jgi:NAD(P)-dependent dehydrogenase (short-subunit alcohol dehydrogenase family)